MKSPNTHTIKKALISVSNKTGIVDFAKELTNRNIELYSTGGTFKLLNENGVNVKYVSELTNFPEIMNGRVKTLHPGVHAGLLADLGKEDHIKELEENNLTSIDLLLVNLYPFEETLNNKSSTHADLIENIDIGGPAMLRAAAKNYRWTAVVINPNHYNTILEKMDSSNNCLDEEFRANLAGEVFSHTAKYDSMIANYFADFNKLESPHNLNIGLKSTQSLRYGENPHQKAHLYGNFDEIFQQLHGKELSYNNIVDIDAASKLSIEFDEEPTVVIVKHTNPCGVGTGKTLAEAYDKAFATDNVSPFGGIMAFNRPMNLEMAEKVHKIFTEVLIAPSFDDDALELLNKKRDRRLIKLNTELLKSSLINEYKSVAGGMLVQSSDIELIDKDKLKVATDLEPNDDQWKALMFAWRICKHVKSNAIIYCGPDRTLGIGAGQMSRVDSARIAASKAKEMGLELKGSVVASDAFFPFKDGLLNVIEAGATAVIQPGGSIRDDEVIEAANENDIAMVFTGMRHFKH